MHDIDKRMEELLARHAAFWRREPAEKPLIRVRRGRKILEHLDVFPSMIDPGTFTLPLSESPVQDDLFRTESVFGGVPWMEAIAGCGIHAGAGEAMWAKTALGAGFEGIEQICRTDDNLWFDKLLELTRALVDSNYGAFLISHTLQRGPMDMLSALMGDERMGLAFYDSADRVDFILKKATNLFLEMTRAQYDIIPPFHGGRPVWAYAVWAPGSVVRLQTDSSVQISADMYKSQVLPHERRIMSAFDYSLMDLHSGGNLRLYKVLIEEDDLNAISVTLDRHESAPGIDNLIPIFEHILSKKSLVVFGTVSREELAALVDALPASGLCIHVSIPEPE